jgi:hypothetical protein
MGGACGHPLQLQRQQEQKGLLQDDDDDDEEEEQGLLQLLMQPLHMLQQQGQQQGWAQQGWQQQGPQQGGQQEPEELLRTGATGGFLPAGSLSYHQQDLWGHQHNVSSQHLMPQPVHTAGDSLPRLQLQAEMQWPLFKPIAPSQDQQQLQQAPSQAAALTLRRQHQSPPQELFSPLLPGETAAASACGTNVSIDRLQPLCHR